MGRNEVCGVLLWATMLVDTAVASTFVFTGALIALVLAVTPQRLSNYLRLTVSLPILFPATGHFLRLPLV